MARTFEELVLPHYNTYIKVATKMCYGDKHKAEDMVQEAMLKAYNNFHEFDDSFKIATWFHRILRNTVMDAQRSDKRARERYYDYFLWKGIHDPFYCNEMSEEETLHKECLDRMPEIIDNLDPTNQTIIKMFMAGEDHLKIGQTVGLTRAGTNFRIRKICKQIRDSLGKLDE